MLILCGCHIWIKILFVANIKFTLVNNNHFNWFHLLSQKKITIQQTLTRSNWFAVYFVPIDVIWKRKNKNKTHITFSWFSFGAYKRWMKAHWDHRYFHHQQQQHHIYSNIGSFQQNSTVTDSIANRDHVDVASQSDSYSVENWSWNENNIVHWNQTKKHSMGFVIEMERSSSKVLFCSA